MAPSSSETGGERELGASFPILNNCLAGASSGWPAVLLYPVADHGHLFVCDIETNAEAGGSDRSADHGRDTDGHCAGEIEGDLDRLPDREWYSRLDQHTPNGKILAFGGDGLGSSVAGDDDGGGERDTRRTSNLTVKLQLCVSGNPGSLPRAKSPKQDH
jgi:hypothetical protein